MEIGEWMGSADRACAKLHNLGKRFFLQLEADALCDINSQSEKSGLKYARKAMIRTVSALNVNGL